MLQEATLDDLEDLLEITEEFVSNTHYKNIYSKEKICIVLKKLIESKEALVLLSIIHNNDGVIEPLKGDKGNIDNTYMASKAHIDSKNHLSSYATSEGSSVYDVSSTSIYSAHSNLYESDHSTLYDNTHPLYGVNNAPYVIQGFLLGTLNEFLLGFFNVSNELAMYVSPLYRSKGISKSLIEYFEEWSKVKGCNIVSLSSLDRSIEALYAPLGYIYTESTYSKVIN